MTSGEIKFCLVVIFLFILPAFMWASKDFAAPQVVHLGADRANQTPSGVAHSFGFESPAVAAPINAVAQVAGNARPASQTLAGSDWPVAAAPIRAVWTTLPASGIPATLRDCPWADITLNMRGASQGGFESWRRVCYRRPR